MLSLKAILATVLLASTAFARPTEKTPPKVGTVSNIFHAQTTPEGTLVRIGRAHAEIVLPDILNSKDEAHRWRGRPRKLEDSVGLMDVLPLAEAEVNTLEGAGTDGTCVNGTLAPGEIDGTWQDGTSTLGEIAGTPDNQDYCNARSFY